MSAIDLHNHQTKQFTSFILKTVPVIFLPFLYKSLVIFSNALEYNIRDKPGLDFYLEAIQPTLLRVALIITISFKTYTASM